MRSHPRTAIRPEPPSITSALLGGPILGNQGVAGQLSSRSLELGKTKGTGSLPKMKAVRETKEPSDPKPGRLWSQRRSLPSYISARSFADAVMDLVVPNPQGRTTMDAIDNSLRALPAATPFRQSLEALVENADGDVSRFRASVEQWYDDHMDRVSGWYKRRVAIITLVFGAIVVILLNLNALTIGRTLYTENAVSAAVSNVAAKTTSCSSADQGLPGQSRQRAVGRGRLRPAGGLGNRPGLRTEGCGVRLVGAARDPQPVRR